MTLEFSNTTPLPAKIYANEGVAQVIFIESDEPCEVSYKDRGGKYQDSGASRHPKYRFYYVGAMRALYICGSLNQTKMMYAVSCHLPEFRALFHPLLLRRLSQAHPSHRDPGLDGDGRKVPAPDARVPERAGREHRLRGPPGAYDSGRHLQRPHRPEERAPFQARARARGDDRSRIDPLSPGQDTAPAALAGLHRDHRALRCLRPLLRSLGGLP